MISLIKKKWRLYSLLIFSWIFIAYAGSSEDLVRATPINSIFAYDEETFQVPIIANAFINLTFSKNSTSQMPSTWHHTPGSSKFTCVTPGVYFIHYNVLSQKVIDGIVNITLRAIVDGAEVSGSSTSATFHSNDTINLTNGFLVTMKQNQILQLQIMSSVNGGGGIVPANGPTATISIIKIV